MNATTTQPRTTAQLRAAADAAHPLGDPNREYHIRQHMLRVIAAAEREAYATEERRTIRPRYIAALDVRRTQTMLAEREAAAEWLTVRKAAGLRHDWVPELGQHNTPEGCAQFRMRFAAQRHEAARNALALATFPGTPEHSLIGLAEDGGLDPYLLLASVPDQYGRCCAFAVDVRTETGGWVERNLPLRHAVAAAAGHSADGRRAVVMIDTCG